MNEAMKQALEKIANVNAMDYEYQRWAREALAIAELESQEPMGWHLIEALYPQGERLDIRMGDGSILCNLLPQADGDLWWDGSGTGEKFIDPVYADVTHWRIHSNTHPPQRKPLTDLKEALVEAMSIINHYGMHGWSKAAHDEGERVMRNARKALAVHNIKE